MQESESMGRGKEAEFLDQLKEYNGLRILCNVDNLITLPVYEHSFSDPSEQEFMRRSVQSAADSLSESGEEIHGRDLGNVKHCDLSEFNDVSNLENIYGKTLFGRFCSVKPVDKHKYVVKTWDFVYFHRDNLIQYPARLRNEIILLTGHLKSHPNVPELVGYCMDKMLAVVYKLKAQDTLRNLLKLGNLEWDARMNIAIQIASLLEHCHTKNIVIGSVDSANIIIDQEGNAKLCEFGLTACMTEMEKNKSSIYYTTGRFSCWAPETDKITGKWTTKTDIYGFGYLLLELITKSEHNPVVLHQWATRMIKEGEESVHLFQLIRVVDLKLLHW